MLTFGRGAREFAGEPLSRAEVRIIIKKLPECTSHVALQDKEHVPHDNRKIDEDARFIVRSLTGLYVKLTPA